MKKGNAKKIVVKKYTAERTAFRIFTGALFYGWIATMIVPSLRYLSPIFPLSLLFLLPFHLYYELWRITFASTEIRIRRWPFRERAYSYSMVKEVTKAYVGGTDRYLICCVFSDGKRISFRLRDENGELAFKRLSRFPIRNASYTWI